MPTDQIMEQEFEALPPQEIKEPFVNQLRSKRKIVLTIGGLVSAVMLGFLLLLFLTSQKPGEKIFLPIVPSPTPTIIEVLIRPASPYATEAAVLKIEEDLKNLDQQLQTTDLKEAGLNPPVLDMKVEFNGQ